MASSPSPLALACTCPLVERRSDTCRPYCVAVSMEQVKRRHEVHGGHARQHRHTAPREGPLPPTLPLRRICGVGSTSKDPSPYRGYFEGALRCTSVLTFSLTSTCLRGGGCGGRAGTLVGETAAATRASASGEEARDNIGQRATRERVGVGVAFTSVGVRLTHVVDAARVDLARDEELQ